MSYRIAICGPHSSGKTTLLHALQMTEEFKGFKSLPEVTRTIREHGVSINEMGDTDTQILIMAKHMQNILLEQDDFIVDRCLIDGFVYTMYLHTKGRVAEYVKDYAMQLMLNYVSRYDLIFYIPCEFAPVDDGVRSTGKEFHEDIVGGFTKIIDILMDENDCANVSCGLNIVTLTGTVEERVAKAKAAFAALEK